MRRRRIPSPPPSTPRKGQLGPPFGALEHHGSATQGIAQTTFDLGTQLEHAPGQC